MKRPSKDVNITIDNRDLTIPSGSTILAAAEAHDIYIPTLCAHKDLTPFGGCRMCIVEVEGMRGFPTACTTPVEDGMVIRTQTTQIQSVRNEILNLILSEHPCSCLICDEKEECRNYSVTVRKVGVTTGCRFCPNDGQCELQEVAAKIGITELNYPIYYRNLRVEKEDPFYDRDYNLCILCGRCVRICQEIRSANAISFKQRGRHTTIGPAYSRTHLDSGCEFCGACVSVCPTGALSEKARKWRGKEDQAVTTTCPLCGIGCQISVLVKGNEVMGSLPAAAPELNNGQLCVKGRFCITELVNTHHRAKRYYRLENKMPVELTPDEALAIAAGKLASCRPDEFGLLISPHCTNEDLYMAQKFARLIMKSNQIDTPLRLHYGSGFQDYVRLFGNAATYSQLRQASVIISIGLDTQYGQSVVGVELRQAIRRGAHIVTIHPRRHGLSVLADVWLNPASDKVADLVQNLTALVEKPAQKTARPTAESNGAALAKAAEIIRGAESAIILVGSEFTHDPESGPIFRAIEKLAKRIGSQILPLPAFNNLIGSLWMGADPELLPGGHSITDKSQRDRIGKIWKANLPAPSRSWINDGELPKLKVLYLIGVNPAYFHHRADFTIVQNSYQPENGAGADIVFPAAAFTETHGTFYNQEARLLQVVKCTDPPGDALPDWQIISRLARLMGSGDFKADTIAEIHMEITEVAGAFDNQIPLELLPDLPGSTTPADQKSNAVSSKPKNSPHFKLEVSLEEHSYRGYPISKWVGGMEKLIPQNVLHINPEDAAIAGIGDRDSITVAAEGMERTWVTAFSKDQPRGKLRVMLDHNDLALNNPIPVTIRKSNV